MARNGTYGEFFGKEVSKYARAIISNAGNISNEELKILEFLAYKGSYEDKKVGFIEENKCYKTKEPCDCSGLCRENY